MVYTTTPQEGIGMTPFHLVYGGEAVVPAEIGMPSPRVNTYDEGNVEKCSLKLDLVEQSHDKAVAQLRTYKKWMC